MCVKETNCKLSDLESADLFLQESHDTLTENLQILKRNEIDGTGTNRKFDDEISFLTTD